MFKTQNESVFSRWAFRLTPLWIALVATPIALFIGLWSVGMGHGDYIVATLLLPLPFITMKIGSGFFTCPEFGDCGPRDFVMFASAVIQFPLYGLLFSFLTRKILLAALLAVIHICFFVGFWFYQGTLGFK